MTSLAVVIPAYKRKFLEKALASLAAQSDRSFVVYIGDDNTPEGLEAIAKEWANRINLHYVRFPQNLGERDLVAQWNRCVGLTTEAWVWLFSDDDEAEEGCVKAWRAAAALHPGADLFHFNVSQIDANSAITQTFPAFPSVMTAAEFVRGRLNRTISSFAPEYLFRRAAWDAIGGFVPFPLAWCSDDATWVSLAVRAGIFTIPGPKVRWRLSSLNISAVATRHARSKAKAATLYQTWLRGLLARGDIGVNGMDAREIAQLGAQWLHGHIGRQAAGQQRVLSTWDSFMQARGWRLDWLRAGARHFYWSFQRPVHRSRGVLPLNE